jgi:CubicO group peptidase (beta-lactamase class C family)
LYESRPYLTSAELLKAVFARPLASEPGAKWAYSNDGYALLALVVERASGTEFREYVRRNLFAPAGLTHTGFVGDRRLGTAPTLARPYGASDRLRAGGNWSGGLGCSDVVSNPHDLFRWEVAMRGERILPAAEKAKLTAATVEAFPGRGIDLRYAYGWWNRTTARGTREVFHSGVEDDGFNAWYSRFVDENVTVIFASNVSPGGTPLRETFFSATDEGALERIIFGSDDVQPPVPEGKATSARRHAAVRRAGLRRRALAAARPHSTRSPGESPALNAAVRACERALSAARELSRAYSALSDFSAARLERRVRIVRVTVDAEKAKSCREKK